jgi:hypothetical protein
MEVLGLHWDMLPRFEWVLFDGVIMGLLVWQLVSVRRLIRIDRDRDRDRAAEGGGDGAKDGGAGDGAT